MYNTETTTLMIRHFPAEVTKEDRISFMKHFGAIEVKCLQSKYKKSSLIFARFESRAIAEAVIKKLHQVELLGQNLSVEFARANDPSKNLEAETSRDEEVKKEEGSAERKLYDGFITRLNSWTGGVKFDAPPPVHLRYAYPPPTRDSLMNIAAALASVPKFYTQTVHLMNKMNLPCPFDPEFHIPLPKDLFPEQKRPTESKAVDTSDLQPLEDEESEMESDPEEGAALKRPLSGLVAPGARKAKKLRLAAGGRVAGGSRAREGPREEVFEGATLRRPLQTTIEVKLRPEADRVEEQQAPAQSEAMVVVEGFEKMEAPPAPPPEILGVPEGGETEKGADLTSIITEQELAANRISTKDQRLLPVFKSYQPGLPSCRLYIKNLAKTVVNQDLEHIYRRYFIENLPEEQGTMFDIRLMQEGRMKGQAFVNLQSVKQAEKALKETNGFILKGKPMVVHFARSSKPK